MDLVSLLRRPFAWGLKRLDLDALYSLKRRGPLAEDGWFRSNRENASVDASGSPLPWMTYPAIEFIRKRVKPDMSVFEYGSGGSTIWWANQVREVISVEHDRAWFEKVAKNVGSRATVYQIDLVYGGEYSRAIQKFQNRFDVVVVDGRDRVNCVKNCLPALKPSGVVILDNSERPEYSEALTFLAVNGFKRIEFVGFYPIVNVKGETTIFYRSANRFGI
jgi:precorrin-6B methylase 2